MTVLQQKRQGLLYLTIAGITISTIPVVAKLGMQQQISAIEFLAIRFALAAIILWGYFAWSQPSVIRIDRRGMWRCGEAALLNSVCREQTGSAFLPTRYITDSLLDNSDPG